MKKSEIQIIKIGLLLFIAACILSASFFSVYSFLNIAALDDRDQAIWSDVPAGGNAAALQKGKRVYPTGQVLSRLYFTIAILLLSLKLLIFSHRLESTVWDVRKRVQKVLISYFHGSKYKGAAFTI